MSSYKELEKQEVLIFVWEQAFTSKKKISIGDISDKLNLSKKKVREILKRHKLFRILKKHNASTTVR